MPRDNSIATRVSLPRDWHAVFSARAESEGVTLSQWLAQAGLKRLPAAERRQLSELRRRGRPKVAKSE